MDAPDEMLARADAVIATANAAIKALPYWRTFQADAWELHMRLRQLDTVLKAYRDARSALTVSLTAVERRTGFLTEG